MKKAVLMLSMLLACSFSFGQSGSGPKVFISVDMEGITGVANWEDVSRSGKDYDIFREIMTGEASAAVEGALAAGAKEIWVRDSHGSGRNILPELLNEKAKLLRDWSGGPKSMVDGIDETFDAVIFIGYHAKAGTPDAMLEHTFTGRITDFSINGVSLPEAGMNALMAGVHDVPVAFVAGDRAICNQAKKLFGTVETVAVKEGIGGAVLNLHPKVAQKEIRAGVEKALKNLGAYKPYKLTPPFKMVLKLKDEEAIYQAALFPGAERTGDWEVTYTSNDLMEVMNAFRGMIQ